MSFVDAHRGELGVEPICTALQVAPSTYYAAKHREREPSARAVRDAVWMPILLALWVANRKVYGARKLWKAARRAGHEIGRDQVARLMRELGVRGVSRRRKMFTTRQNPDAVRAPDLVNRDFTADRPDALWVTDLTYVATRAGMAYVCFIVDAFSRRIVGLAGRFAHAHRDGPRRIGDGPPLTRRPPPGRARGTLRRRIAIHVAAIHRTPRRDRHPPQHRHRRRFL